MRDWRPPSRRDPGPEPAPRGRSSPRRRRSRARPRGAARETRPPSRATPGCFRLGRLSVRDSAWAAAAAAQRLPPPPLSASAGVRAPCPALWARGQGGTEPGWPEQPCRGLGQARVSANRPGQTLGLSTPRLPEGPGNPPAAPFSPRPAPQCRLPGALQPQRPEGLCPVHPQAHRGEGAGRQGHHHPRAVQHAHQHVLPGRHHGRHCRAGPGPGQ